MQFRTILRILGVLLSLFSLTMLPPFMVSIFYKDGGGLAFSLSQILILFFGGSLWFYFRHDKNELRTRDGFLVVVLFWTVLSLSGALPFWLSEKPNISFSDSVFESFSGLTTTGATILTNIDSLPHAILFYRQQLQWLGGMGIIVLAVAILPMLGIGGMQLYRAETPGPVKDSKLTPRIAGTAKALWNIYLGLTVSCALAYWFAGMSVFDAICHSFSTVAIGGFSTHDLSIGYFNSPAIEVICAIFMFIAGINFSLHFVAFRRMDLKNYFADPEFKVYTGILLSISLVTFLILVVTQVHHPADAWHHALFQAISIGTTTGFTTTEFAEWPSILPLLLLLSSFIGGCAGSTAGGIKVIRFLLLFKQGMREIKLLIHPNAVFLIKLGKTALKPRVIQAVWGFFATYVLMFFIIMLLLVADGMPQVEAFSAVAACLNNLGPGLGDVAANYSHLTDHAKWLLSFAMLLGRLEIFTMLVLFTPAFWRR
ncbi:MAG: TrkH family potassium uptake protein [Pseudomonadota bacterium]